MAQYEQPRCPQLNDDVVITIEFPPTTEEWAEELIAETEEFDSLEVTRTDKALVIKQTVSGNLNGLDSLSHFVRNLSDCLLDGNIDPMEFDVKVRATEVKR